MGCINANITLISEPLNVTISIVKGITANITVLNPKLNVNIGIVCDVIDLTTFNVEPEGDIILNYLGEQVLVNVTSKYNWDIE
jgi:hypothetical protein